MGDLKRGVIGFVSHLADNLPVATGVALAFKIRGESRVAIAGSGDGGTSRGDFHEAMNFAAVRKLPVVLFCNNNQYAYSTPQRLQMAIHDVVDRAKAYGMPPVVNLKKILKVAGNPGCSLIVINSGKGVLGLLVDAAKELLETGQKPVPLPRGVLNSSYNYYAGILQNREDLVLLLNEDGLLP